MTVKIIRNTGFLGMGSSFRVLVNEEKRQKVKNDQTVVINIPSSPTKIQVTQYGVKSKEMLVDSGDEVEITTRLIGKLFLPLLILSSLMQTLISNLSIRTVISANLLFVSIVLGICFLIPGAIFQLKKVDTKPW